jgi:multiple sugar transport system substrate-binding protein
MKRFAVLSLFIISALVLVACGPAKTAAPETAAVTEQPEATAIPTEEAEPVNVTFWYPYGEGSWTGDFLAGKISAFNEANPNIVVTGQSFADYSSIIEAIQRGAAANELPSIATVGFGFDDYIIDSNLGTPIEDLLGAENAGFLDDFFPTLLDATTRDGKIYGIPLALSVATVFYYPDLFEQAGLDPNNPPQTWEDFLAAAETIKQKLDIPGATFALDDPWTFETAVRSNCGSLVTEDGKSNLTSPEVVKVLTDWGAGAESGAILYNSDFMQTLQTFGAKQVAMFVVSSYGTTYYAGIDPTIKAMPFPAGEGCTFQSPAGGNSLYVLGNSDAERAAAMQFIIYLTAPDANAEWAINSGYLPTRQSALDEMTDFITGFDNYQIAVNSIKNVVPPTQWPSRHVLEINQIMLQAIEATMLGTSTAEEALQNANTQINALINE